MVLAELALACPMSISEGEKLFFGAHNTDDCGRSVRRHLSRSEFLEEVKSATSWHYKSAVKYCLRQDASTCSRSDVPTYNHAHFYESVVEPLDKHYQPLRKHIEDHPELYKTFRQEVARFAAG